MEDKTKETSESRASRIGASAFCAVCSIVLMFVAAAAVFLAIGYLLQSNWLMALAAAVVVLAAFFLLNRLMRSSRH